MYYLTVGGTTYADVPTLRPIVVNDDSLVCGAVLAGAPPVGAGAPVVAATGAPVGAAAPPSFLAGVAPPMPPYAYFSFFSAGLRIYT
jgi:hypothetical protein